MCWCWGIQQGSWSPGMSGPPAKRSDVKSALRDPELIHVDGPSTTGVQPEIATPVCIRIAASQPPSTFSLHPAAVSSRCDAVS